jgi:aminoglycoside phosphotransferase (APT) family kinase protein
MGNQLRKRLTDVATFLGHLHNRSNTRTSVHETRVLNYMEKITNELVYWRIISGAESERLTRLRRRWAEAQVLGAASTVTIHGDATPTNFLWDNEHGLAVIDLERLSIGDRAADLGCLAAELKHLFWNYGHGATGGEPYIQHLYASYFDSLPAGVEDFASLTLRGRFYMGCVLLRISRNIWLDLKYRRQLIEDALECLKI